MSTFGLLSSHSPAALLNVAFATITPPDNWKLPISAVIASSAFQITCEACIYYTGSILQQNTQFIGPLHPNQVAVIADGYYVAVGA